MDKVREKKKSLSIKARLLLMISILVFLSVTLVTLATYGNYREGLIEQSQQNSRILLEQLAINMDTYVFDLKRLCYYPFYNNEVMLLLKSVPQNAKEQLAKQRTLESFLEEMLTIPRQDVIRAYFLCNGIYSSKKTQYDAPISSNYQDDQWYKQTLESSEPIILPIYSETHAGNSLNILSLVYRLSDSEGNPFGAIRVDANYNGITALCDRASESEDNPLIIIDNDGNLIYQNEHKFQKIDKKALEKALSQCKEGEARIIRIEDQEFSMTYRCLTSAPWKIIDLHSMKSITASADKARTASFLLAILFAALGVGASFIFVKEFVRPIYSITDLMKKLQGGDFTVKATVKGNDELAFLARAFNEMTQKLNEAILRNNALNRQVYEAKYLEKEAQFTALYNQIQPHFLFNSLNTISLLVKCGRYEESIQCIEMLATLLDALVDSDNEISLARELSIVESYLRLQQKRYGNLSYSILVSKELKDSLHLPALTIQPVVENAVIHGCEPKRGKRHIQVSISQEGEHIHISVKDNGIGMTAQELNELRTKLKEQSQNIEEKTKGSHGIGLVNICRRLRLKYALAFQMNVDSSEGMGTEVIFTLPLEDKHV